MENIIQEEKDRADTLYESIKSDIDERMEWLKNEVEKEGFPERNRVDVVELCYNAGNAQNTLKTSYLYLKEEKTKRAAEIFDKSVLLAKSIIACFDKRFKYTEIK